jgi:hypothetical protein
MSYCHYLFHELNDLDLELSSEEQISSLKEEEDEDYHDVDEEELAGVGGGVDFDD